MDELLKRVDELRAMARRSVDRFEGRCQHAADVFNRVFNRATLTRELLHYYNEVWGRQTTTNAGSVEEAVQQNGERCMIATRDMYVGLFSAFEKAVRDVIGADPGHPLGKHLERRERLVEVFDSVYEVALPEEQERWRRVRKTVKDVPPFDSFDSIRRGAVKRGLIDASDADVWRLLVEIRNIVVHNNGIAWRDVDAEVDGRTLALREGKMTQGKLDTFVHLSAALLAMAERWLDRLCDDANDAGHAAV